MLTGDQKAKYEQIRQTAVVELEQLDREIEAELNKVKTRLLELQEDKKAVKQILDGACARLGTPSSGPLKDISLSDLGSHVARAKAEPSPLADIRSSSVAAAGRYAVDDDGLRSFRRE
ncbi:MAG: hypothetical protein LC791_18220 [Acidobacteria bacterium]|nr:hypothetical protein [Acidobacteriota bacterium]